MSYLEKLPLTWQTTLSAMDTAQLACLLSQQHDNRMLWPLSLLAFHACTRAFSLSRTGIKASLINKNSKSISTKPIGKCGAGQDVYDKYTELSEHNVSMSSGACENTKKKNDAADVCNSNIYSTDMRNQSNSFDNVFKNGPDGDNSNIYDVTQIIAKLKYPCKQSDTANLNDTNLTNSSSHACRVPGVEYSHVEPKTGTGTNLHGAYRRHVKPKKLHEIDRLSQVISELSRSCGVRHVVDVGAGQGHLSRLLTLRHQLNVTSVEAATEHAPKAHQFHQKAHLELKKWEAKVNRPLGDLSTLPIHHLPNHVVHHICKDITPDQFTDLLGTSSCQRGASAPCSASSSSQSTICNGIFTPGPTGAVPEFTLTGLHACGDLSATMLRVYAGSPQCVALASVACCYSKLTTRHAQEDADVVGYPLSQYLHSLPEHELSFQARELACHSLEAYHQRLLENGSRLILHCYRATLQRIILEKDPSFTHGQIKLNVKRAELLPFEQYASLALAHLGLDPSLSASQVRDAHLSLTQWKDVVAFHTLRMSLAPVIETIILLDRILYLQEAGLNSAIVPLFDPLLSPRNFLLLSVKDRYQCSDSSCPP